MQLDAENDESVFYKPPVYQGEGKTTGNEVIDRARAAAADDSD